MVLQMTLARILVVGERSALNHLADHLEGAGRYRLSYVLPGRGGLRLEPRPDVVLLSVPEEPEAAERALAWLDFIKNQVPVVVLSSAAGMSFYLAAMNRGAFDYLTCLTPPEEVARVLSAAIGWRRVA
ncbi:MAG: hypothetical protein V3U28_03430 [Candidatus Acidoferrales bacterium]